MATVLLWIGMALIATRLILNLISIICDKIQGHSISDLSINFQIEPEIIGGSEAIVDKYGLTDDKLEGVLKKTRGWGLRSKTWYYHERIERDDGAFVLQYMGATRWSIHPPSHGASSCLRGPRGGARTFWYLSSAIQAIEDAYPSKSVLELMAEAVAEEEDEESVGDQP